MYLTIGKIFYIANLQQSIEAYVQQCDSCQRHKAINRPSGNLAPREDAAYLFEEVAVDCIGLWTITVQGMGQVQFNALMVVDTTTLLSELTRLANKSSEHVAMKFENEWLSRYQIGRAHV